jgi:kynureninase
MPLAITHEPEFCFKKFSSGGNSVKLVTMISPERQYKNDESFAAEMDAADPLKHFRDKFYLPRQQNGEEYVYFTGNSLGLQPKTARGYVEQELKDWETLGVKAHLEAKTPWLPYHEFLTEQMAGVIGGKPSETVVMNSLTVNLHLLMVSFYRPTETRRKIVIERGAFPSDQYAVASQIAFHRNKNGAPADAGATDKSLLIELTPREGEAALRTEDIIETIEKEGDSIALILLGGVNYYTGQAFEMQRITEAGHKVGAVVGFDLAHAAGNLELRMHDWKVDFAAWCSYKYLNAGPGAVAGAFVHERHAESFELPRFAGWWGHDKETRFLMGPNFKPIAGAEGWQISNPPILQMAALRASLEVFAEAGMTALVEKSRRLTGYLEYLLDEIQGAEGGRISVITPRDPAQRGCQLSIRVKDADKTLYQKISARGVLADWREPDVIRVAPAPLYNSFADVYKFSRILAETF